MSYDYTMKVKQKSWICFLVLIFVIGQKKVHGYFCLNDIGKPVDWFLVMKAPNSTKYSFISSESSSTWQYGKNILNHGPVYNTLQQTYRAMILNNTLVAMYSDKNPTNIEPSNQFNGHMKGVLTYNMSSTGFWLTHSWPKFPSVLNISVTDSSMQFAHSLICVTTSATNVNNIGIQLYVAGAKMYKLTVSSAFLKTSAVWLKFYTNKRDPKSTVLNTTMKFKSYFQNITFTHFSKSELLKKDLYADWIAPHYQHNLLVKSWVDLGKNQKALLPSSCKKNAYSVENIIQLRFGQIKQNVNATHDGSIWAVSNVARAKWSLVCIGDVDRMNSVVNRGGGALCFSEVNSRRKLMEMVTIVEYCPRAYNSELAEWLVFAMLIVIFITLAFIFTFRWTYAYFEQRMQRHRYNAV